MEQMKLLFQRMGRMNLEKQEQSKMDHILAELEKLEYGSITITVHDGQITQIDTTEKKRFPLKSKSVSK